MCFEKSLHVKDVTVIGRSVSTLDVGPFLRKLVQEVRQRSGVTPVCSTKFITSASSLSACIGSCANSFALQDPGP
eukprot:4142365-Amphidinium_carterae.1